MIRHFVYTPLPGEPYTSLKFKLGVAKLYGLDPTPIGEHEKLLKLSSGDIEFNTCWHRAFSRKPGPILNIEKQLQIRVVIAALVDLAEVANRTLLLPRYFRDNYAWAVPTHAIVNIATLGVNYCRVMPQVESYRFLEAQEETDNRQVLSAGRNYSETRRRVLLQEDSGGIR
jgi:hypothetical protein